MQRVVIWTKHTRNYNCFSELIISKLTILHFVINILPSFIKFAVLANTILMSKNMFWTHSPKVNGACYRVNSRHSLENCDGCLKKGVYRSVLAQFPIKGLWLQKKAEKAGLFKEKKLYDITQKTLNKLNKQLKQDHGTSFTTEVRKVFKVRKQINKGHLIRATKENIE